MNVSRRSFLVTGPVVLGLAATSLQAETDEAIHVVKDPGCPCCGGWIAHLRDSGFRVSFEERSLADLETFKRERGIPEALASCHTAVLGEYTLEGHVPAADIRRLLDERPVAIGLSVPGMVQGSPGMGPETERKAYDVILIGTGGSGSVFTSYPAA